mmetsp:Transcript_4679/g.14606  ORF Transcript_4679/g.14606 Transcript_4679/m.14606 type:complete len:252 (-) Transcript_4679:278-1033(-)
MPRDWHPRSHRPRHARTVQRTARRHHVHARQGPRRRHRRLRGRAVRCGRAPPQQSEALSLLQFRLPGRRRRLAPRLRATSSFCESRRESRRSALAEHAPLPPGHAGLGLSALGPPRPSHRPRAPRRRQTHDPSRRRASAGSRHLRRRLLVPRRPQRRSSYPLPDLRHPHHRPNRHRPRRLRRRRHRARPSLEYRVPRVDAALRQPEGVARGAAVLQVLVVERGTAVGLVRLGPQGARHHRQGIRPPGAIFF